MVCEVLHFIRRGEFMPKRTKPRAFFTLESKCWTDTIRRCKGKWCKCFYTLLKNIKLFSGFEFRITARIAQHKSDHANLSVWEYLHTIERWSHVHTSVTRSVQSSLKGQIFYSILGQLLYRSNSRTAVYATNLSYLILLPELFVSHRHSYLCIKVFVTPLAATVNFHS